MAILQKLIALFVHMCRAHAYRAIGLDWICSSDRILPTESSEHLRSMFKHVANEMTLTPRLSDTMTFLCSVIVILQKEFIKVTKFNLQSPTRDHRNHDEMDVIAANLQVMRCQQAKTLLISSDEMLKARLEEVKKKFNTRHDKFLGTKFTESIRSYFNAPCFCICLPLL